MDRFIIIEKLLNINVDFYNIKIKWIKKYIRKYIKIGLIMDQKIRFYRLK